MIRVLLIDDEPLVLAELKRGLEESSPDWEMAFVESGAKALELQDRVELWRKELGKSSLREAV